MASSLEEVFKELVSDPDPMTQVLGLYALGESAQDFDLLPEIRRYANSEKQMVKEAAGERWIVWRRVFTQKTFQQPSLP